VIGDLGHVKIISKPTFEYSPLLDNMGLHTVTDIGTPVFNSPELKNCKSSHSRYDPEKVFLI
jgi:hypothetical protein